MNLSMTMKRTLNRAALLTTGLLVLGGCAVGGYDEFTCPDPQDGVCTDAYTAMELASNGKTADDFPSNTHINHSSSAQSSSPETGHSHSEHPDSSHLASPNGSSSPYRDVAPVAGLMRRPVDQPKPVLLPATVLEMWFAPYEDANGVLRMPQTAFAEVTPRKWTLTNTKVEQFKSAGPFSSNTHDE